MEYGRTYRAMLPSDILSAARGLEMEKKSTPYLYELIDVHSSIDAFASAVIVEAAHRELDRRWMAGENP